MLIKVIPSLLFRTPPLPCSPQQWTRKVTRWPPPALGPGCRTHLEVIDLLQSVIELFSHSDEHFFRLSAVPPLRPTKTETLHSLLGCFILALWFCVEHWSGHFHIYFFHCLTLWKPSNFYPLNTGRSLRGDGIRGFQPELSFWLS